MRKKFTLIKIFVYLKYLPVIILEIKNWPLFLLNYLGIKNGPQTYEFRNGIKIKTGDGVSTATVSVIFIKRDYGKIKDRSIIIDIGANIGVFSIYAGSSKDTIIYAFEPVKSNYNLLLENIRINNLEKKIFPFMLAVGTKREKRTIYLGDSPFNSFYQLEGLSAKKTVEVDCVSLGDVFKDNKIEKCDLLKMDCEGAEFEILYNLHDEYFKKIKEIRLEYHSNPSELISFLRQKGFCIKKVKETNPSNGDLWLELT